SRRRHTRFKCDWSSDVCSSDLVASLALGLVFLYLPMIILIIYSFNASRLVTVWGGWSLRWYYEFLHDRAMIEAGWMSLRVGAMRSEERRVGGEGGGWWAGGRRA